jgi:hypothetical protein
MWGLRLLPPALLLLLLLLLPSYAGLTSDTCIVIIHGVLLCNWECLQRGGVAEALLQDLLWIDLLQRRKLLRLKEFHTVGETKYWMQ